MTLPALIREQTAADPWLEPVLFLASSGQDGASPGAGMGAAETALAANDGTPQRAALDGSMVE